MEQSKPKAPDKTNTRRTELKNSLSHLTKFLVVTKNKKETLSGMINPLQLSDQPISHHYNSLQYVCCALFGLFQQYLWVITDIQCVKDPFGTLIQIKINNFDQTHICILICTSIPVDGTFQQLKRASVDPQHVSYYRSRRRRRSSGAGRYIPFCEVFKQVENKYFMQYLKYDNIITNILPFNCILNCVCKIQYNNGC
ncbi:Hypothetical_protein [Hexamita inflata]|uniref:Hypothetical_protein n=1 Tax=Hexamita inflata TaxID=28002 RepID=A0AA86NG64_9EUKA|nr:Hypothetical protein HINF_LOCUS6051 [Hexamita inflata]